MKIKQNNEEITIQGIRDIVEQSDQCGTVEEILIRCPEVRKLMASLDQMSRGRGAQVSCLNQRGVAESDPETPSTRKQKDFYLN